MNRRPALLPIAAATAFGMAVSVHAQEIRPFYIGVGETLSYEDNLFSASNNQPKSDDTISATSLTGGVSETYGRQQVHASGSVSRSIYKTHSDLDNTGYTLSTGLDWETIANLSGTLAFNAGQSLTRNNNTLGLAATTERNIQRTRQTSGSVRWGGGGRLSLLGSASHRSTRASSVLHAIDQNTQNVGSLDANYAFSSALTAGVGVSAGKTDYPNGIINLSSASGFESDSSKRRDVYLTTNWQPSGASSLSARVGYGRTRYEKATQRNVSGPRGQIGWNWTPTGKLQFSTSYNQETGDQTAFIPALANNPSLSSDSSVLTRSLSLGVTYQATGKISTQASIAHTKRDVASSSSIGGNVQSSRSSDSTDTYMLGATWQPTRTLSFNCGAHHEVRGGGGGLTRGYESTGYFCSGQLTLR
jgi:hypothetical protein